MWRNVARAKPTIKAPKSARITGNSTGGPNTVSRRIRCIFFDVKISSSIANSKDRTSLTTDPLQSNGTTAPMHHTAPHGTTRHPHTPYDTDPPTRHPHITDTARGSHIRCHLAQHLHDTALGHRTTAPHATAPTCTRHLATVQRHLMPHGTRTTYGTRTARSKMRTTPGQPPASTLASRVLLPGCSVSVLPPHHRVGLMPPTQRFSYNRADHSPMIGNFQARPSRTDKTPITDKIRQATEENRKKKLPTAGTSSV